MVTIPIQLSNELARELLPFQDRLSEIIELGLRQVQVKSGVESGDSTAKLRVMAALASTGIVTLPEPIARRKPRPRRMPIAVGGPPASELIIAERHGEL